MYKKTHVFFSFCATLYKYKMKKIHGFSYYKNIANFEAFRWNISLSAKLLFMKSAIAPELD